MNVNQSRDIVNSQSHCTAACTTPEMWAISGLASYSLRSTAFVQYNQPYSLHLHSKNLVPDAPKINYNRYYVYMSWPLTARVKFYSDFLLLRHANLCKFMHITQAYYCCCSFIPRPECSSLIQDVLLFFFLLVVQGTLFPNILARSEPLAGGGIC